MTPAVPLTLLYVPADRPDRIRRALDSAADTVIIDLEDAVAGAAKQAARRSVAAIRLDPTRDVQIRVNAAGTPWHDDDLAMVAALDERVSLRLPKCESAAIVTDVASRVGDRALHLLIESALGVEHAFQLAGCHPRVATIGLGEADLLADLRAADPAALGWARGRIVTAAAAAGLAAPTMSVYPDHRDLEGLRSSSALGRSLGFLGRTAIHPAQLAVISEVFTPTAAEIAVAQDVVAAAEAGEQLGRGAVVLPSGKFVDAAVVRQARTVLALTERGRDL